MGGDNTSSLERSSLLTPDGDKFREGRGGQATWEKVSRDLVEHRTGLRVPDGLNASPTMTSQLVQLALAGSQRAAGEPEDAHRRQLTLPGGHVVPPSLSSPSKDVV